MIATVKKLRGCNKKLTQLPSEQSKRQRNGRQRREMIKTSPGGQHWNHSVPERENRENVGKEMSHKIFQKNFTALRNKLRN